MSTEALCSLILLDKDDPTRLTYKEIKESWGSCLNFVRSYGFKDYDTEGIEDALEISRAIKAVYKIKEKEKRAY